MFQFFNAAFLFFFHFRFFYYWPPYLLGLIEPHFCLRPSNIKTDTREPRGKPQIIRKGRLYKKNIDINWNISILWEQHLPVAFHLRIFPESTTNETNCVAENHTTFSNYTNEEFSLQFNECELSEIQRHLYCFYL